MVSSSTYTTHRSEAANTARAASRIICPTDKLEKMEFRTIGHYPGATHTLNQRFCGYEECRQPGTIIEDCDYASRRLTETSTFTYISLHRSCYESVFGEYRTIPNNTTAQAETDATPSLSPSTFSRAEDV
jgi:hypothetical protein